MRKRVSSSIAVSAFALAASGVAFAADMAVKARHHHLRPASNPTHQNLSSNVFRFSAKFAPHHRAEGGEHPHLDG